MLLEETTACYIGAAVVDQIQCPCPYTVVEAGVNPCVLQTTKKVIPNVGDVNKLNVVMLG